METKIYNIDDNYHIDFNKIKKTVVNYTVIIFGIIIILIFILLILYYITPNNYEILKFDNKKFKFKNEIELIIEPNSKIKINKMNDDVKTCVKLPIETNVVIKNIFKSQNICINNDDELIKLRYDSEIFLINDSNSQKKIIAQFYSIIYT